MDRNGDNVTLIVKAPLHDETVACTMSWTIERLKRHLSEVYPNKPNPADQKLIYYGRVLDDSETLRDILNRFNAGGSVHTLHLMGVDTPSLNTPSTTPQQPPSTPSPGNSYFMNPAGYQPWMNDANSGYLQQLALAQQAYMTYMNQYMDMLARHHGDNVYGPAADVQRPPEPVPPRVDDDERHRDWLDYFYILARVIVLFSIVYFYSSPARFMIVSFLGFAMYLYQIGFFRVNPVPAFDNNNELLNNNVAPENNLVPPVPGEAAAAAPAPPAPPAPVREDAVEPPPPTADQPLLEQRPSLMSLTWTFFSSFVASLIPDTQNAV